MFEYDIFKLLIFKIMHKYLVHKINDDLGSNNRIRFQSSELFSGKTPLLQNIDTDIHAHIGVVNKQSI